MAATAQNEARTKPRPPRRARLGAATLQRSFAPLKRMTIDGCRTSKIGLRGLRYIGNAAPAEFPGCNHPDCGA